MISTEIGSMVKHMSYEKAVEAVAKAGFDGFDLSMIYMARYLIPHTLLITMNA